MTNKKSFEIIMTTLLSIFPLFSITFS